MSKFKANNSTIKTNHAFYRRLKYATEMDDGIDDKSLEAMRDFTFSDYVNYGKTNRSHETIIPKPNLMKTYGQSRTDSRSIKMVEFVTDQLNALMDNVSKRILVGRVPKSSFLNQLRPIMGYVDPVIEYSNYMNRYLDNFLQTYLHNNKKNILTFDNYLQTFYDYVEKMSPEFPCTLTAWYKTKKSSPFCSGLYIDLLGISKHDDRAKEIVVLDQSFPHYLNACKQFGFFVSKNNPNVIVCDLLSPATTPYLFNYNIANPNAIFDLYYTKTSDYDLFLLMDNLLNHYKQFITMNPDRREFQFGKNGHMISKLTQRNNIDNINIYNNKYIIYYINIRNIEENKYYNKPDLQEVIENMIFLSNRLDSNKLMSYINLQFAKNSATREGSINWFKNYQEG